METSIDVGELMFRDVTGDDADELYHIYETVLTETDEYSEKEVEKFLFDRRSEMFEAVYQQNNTVAAVQGDEIIGYCSGRGENLHGVYVLPQYRDQGVEEKLLSQLESRARRNGVRALSIIANPDLTDFYKRNGFTLVDKKFIDPLGNNDPIPCDLLQKKLYEDNTRMGARM